MIKKEEYLKLVKELTPKPKRLKNYIIAFTIGGLVGMIGEIVRLFISREFALSYDASVSYVLLLTIFAASLLTALGIFDELVSKFKCGLIIPITGFAHSVTSSALDYKKEGFISIGSNIFKLAGSVILYGIVSGFIFGIIKVIIYV